MLFSFSFAEKVEDLIATDYVNDFANVLTVEQKDELSKMLGDLEKQTGDQVAVAIVTKMEDEFGNADYIEHFAVKLFEKWGIGKAGSEQDSDKGVLFLISVDDRVMRIEIGYGLESVLTDGITKSIQDNYVRPEFKNGDYYTGVKAGIEKISEVLTTGNVDVGTTPGGSKFLFSSIPHEFFVFLFFIFINIFGWLFAVIARTKSWWLGGFITFVIGIPFLLYFGFNLINDLIFFFFTLFGFLFDFLVSKNYKYWEQQFKETGNKHGPDWWAGGTWGPGSGSWTGRDSGSGFGGFGGGSSGGGGSSSSW